MACMAREMPEGVDAAGVPVVAVAEEDVAAVTPAGAALETLADPAVAGLAADPVAPLAARFGRARTVVPIDGPSTPKSLRTRGLCAAAPVAAGAARRPSGTPTASTMLTMNSPAKAYTGVREGGGEREGEKGGRGGGRSIRVSGTTRPWARAGTKAQRGHGHTNEP